MGSVLIFTITSKKMVYIVHEVVAQIYEDWPSLDTFDRDVIQEE